jgi:hypothetical protein
MERRQAELDKAARREARREAKREKRLAREQKREEKRAAGREFKDGYRLVVVSLRGTV